MLSKKAKTDSEEDVDVSNQVRSFEPLLGTHEAWGAQTTHVSQIWEDMSPWAWRNSIYTPEAADNCMVRCALLAACALTIRNLV